MKLKIEINMDGAAFDGWQAGSEVARVLENFASGMAGRDLNREADLFTLRDANGNTVGVAMVTEDAPAKELALLRKQVAAASELAAAAAHCLTGMDEAHWKMLALGLVPAARRADPVHDPLDAALAAWQGVVK